MYKPPLNSNRVKSIKNKFENIDNSTTNTETSPKQNNTAKNGTRNNLSATSPKPPLSRQLSDPLKRNIKRTPAFRLEKNIEVVPENSFQRKSVLNRSTLFENKVKQFSALKTNCDTNNSNVVNNSDSANNNKHVNNISLLTSDNKRVNNTFSGVKPLLIKSKSSHDFALIRSKFDKAGSNSTNLQLSSNKNTNFDNNQRCDIDKDKLLKKDLSVLYTEPIPRSLRVQKCAQIDVVDAPQIANIYTASTLKISDEKPAKKPLPPALEECIISGLTDTLKTALKRPLPCGPAPQKPPRTFQHAAPPLGEDREKNKSFLHLAKEVQKKLTVVKQKPKSDPKLMLTKLENALRNNKLRSRRKAKVDISTTSGEDSDDSLLFRSKSRTLPKLPTSPNSNETNNFSNLNCLNLGLTSMNCSNSTYERIKEPSSSFFVSREEPVYAEPFNFKSAHGSIIDRDIKNKNIRNSLYYMSSPVISGNEKMEDFSECSSEKKMDDRKPQDLSLSNCVKTQASAETSSLSSFTSDLDTPSPMDDQRMKCIIDAFESKNIDDGDRVQTLKHCLQKTINNSFRDMANDDEDSSTVCDIISKFQTYIKSVPKYCQPKIHKDSLFYCCLIIERVKSISQIKFKFPECAPIPANIEILCFPENEDVMLDSTNNYYSLSLTNDKGERTYGYCRRVLPEGSQTCLPLAYCILSKYRAPRFYKKVLIELESRHGIRNKFRDELITQFYNQKFPKPGESIRINLRNLVEPKTDNKENVLDKFGESLDLTSYVHINKMGDYASVNRRKEKPVHVYVCPKDVANSCLSPSLIVEDSDKTELMITLHQDTLYEDADLKRLHKLPVDIIQKIFSSLLLERKVILISSVISDVSSCVDSLQSLLHPFTWCHTFIPILPEAIWDIVESPTPVICGVLSVDVVENHNIENGIVVDLDSGTVLVEEGDENKIMSGSMQKAWRKSLAFANKSAEDVDYVHNVYLRQAYLQVFRLCFQNFHNYIVDGIFQKKEFIKNGKTKGIRQFLKMFTETTMFMAFEDSVINSPDVFAELDVKFNINCADNYNKVLDKLFEWNR